MCRCARFAHSSVCAIAQCASATRGACSCVLVGRCARARRRDHNRVARRPHRGALRGGSRRSRRASVGAVPPAAAPPRVAQPGRDVAREGTWRGRWRPARGRHRLRARRRRAAGRTRRRGTQAPDTLAPCGSDAFCTFRRAATRLRAERAAGGNVCRFGQRDRGAAAAAGERPGRRERVAPRCRGGGRGVAVMKRDARRRGAAGTKAS